MRRNQFAGAMASKIYFEESLKDIFKLGIFGAEIGPTHDNLLLTVMQF